MRKSAAERRFTHTLRLTTRALYAFAFEGGKMKPNDENGKLSTAVRPFRVLIISGPDRRQYCPGVEE